MVREFNVLVVSNVVDARFIERAVNASGFRPTKILSLYESGAIRDWADDMKIPFQFMVGKGDGTMGRLMQNAELAAEAHGMVCVLNENDLALGAANSSVGRLTAMMNELAKPVFITRIRMTETQRMNY